MEILIKFLPHYGAVQEESMYFILYYNFFGCLRVHPQKDQAGVAQAISQSCFSLSLRKCRKIGGFHHIPCFLYKNDQKSPEK